MVNRVTELENLLHIMENSKHWDANQLQLIQQFRTMIETNEANANIDIRIHSQGLRQNEAETTFFKFNRLDVKHELSDFEFHVLCVLCEYMSQDNIIVTTRQHLLTILSLKRTHTLSSAIKRLIELGYICKVPSEILLLGKNDGLVLMVNPLIASKSRDTTELENNFIEFSSALQLKKVFSRINNIHVDLSQINVGTALKKCHKLRYNQITAVNKKVPVAKKQTDTSSINQIIPLTANQINQGSNT